MTLEIVHRAESEQDDEQEETRTLLYKIEHTTSEEAESAMESMSDALDAVNLDEVTSDTFTVSIKEFFTETYTDPRGRQRKRRTSEIRTVELENYVPTSIFNKMLKSRNQLMRHLKHEKADNQEVQTALMAWASEPVLWVWQLTEEEMTLKELEEGLDPLKIQKLFARFFGKRLRQQKNKA